MNNKNITRRFSSLIIAVETLEAEGKLDLSYNRELAIRDAKYTDHRSKPTVLELDGELCLICKASDGLLCLTKYSPFSSCMHDGELAASLPVDESGKISELGNAVALSSIGAFSNTRESRSFLARLGMIAGF